VAWPGELCDPDGAEDETAEEEDGLTVSEAEEEDGLTVAEADEGDEDEDGDEGAIREAICWLCASYTEVRRFSKRAVNRSSSIASVDEEAEDGGVREAADVVSGVELVVVVVLCGVCCCCCSCVEFIDGSEEAEEEAEAEEEGLERTSDGAQTVL